jgi:hypothetical protein
MGPNGKVYVCWAGVTSVSPFTEDFVGVASQQMEALPGRLLKMLLI